MLKTIINALIPVVAGLLEKLLTKKHTIKVNEAVKNGTVSDFDSVSLKNNFTINVPRDVNLLNENTTDK